MKLEIQTHNKGLVFELLEKSSARVGDSVIIPGNAKLTYEGGYAFKSYGIPEIQNFILTKGEDIIVACVANWLYEKLKGDDIKVLIDGCEIIIDEEEIKRIVERK